MKTLQESQLIKRMMKTKLRNDLKEDIQNHLLIEEKNLSDNGIEDGDRISEHDSELIDADFGSVLIKKQPISIKPIKTIQEESPEYIITQPYDELDDLDLYF